jgi:hypothetical protein
MPTHRKNSTNPLYHQTVKITPVSNFFGQENLTRFWKFLQNKDNLTPSFMGAFGKLSAPALVLAGSLNAAEAQETPENVVLAAMAETPRKVELVIPNPDGGIKVDVSRVSMETQAEILGHLAECLQEGFEFADADGNEELDELEVYDLRFFGEECADVAVSDLKTADAEARIENADARIENAEARIVTAGAQITNANARQAEYAERLKVSRIRRAEAQAEIEAITKGLMEGPRAQGG